jgi:hypothetical protein
VPNLEKTTGFVRTVVGRSTRRLPYPRQRQMYLFPRHRSKRRQGHNPLSRQKHNLGSPGLQDGSP